MLKRLIFCFAILLFVCGQANADEKPEKKNKITKKERKAAEKAAKNSDGDLEAIQGLPPRSSNWKSGPSSDWELNFNNAALKAKSEKKKLFVLRTNSDGNSKCKKLKSTVLANSKFRKFTNNSFVLVFLDYPSNIKLPVTQQQHNDMVSKKFKFAGDVPSALIINPENLKVEGHIIGIKPAKEYIKFLQKYVPVSAKNAKNAKKAKKAKKN